MKNILTYPFSIIPVKSNSKFCISLVFFLFFLYNLTFCPTIYWSDSPEFSNTAYTLGIGHPAGFPSYSLISKGFTFFPLASIAVRVNFVSMFFAIFTGVLTFFVILELIKICFGEKKNTVAQGNPGYHFLNPTMSERENGEIHKNKSFSENIEQLKEKNLPIISASLGVLILSVAGSFWWMATVSELYTMNCFFVALFFLVTLKWYQSLEQKYIFLASFILGISSAVYGANLLFVPALIVCYLLSKDKKLFNKLLLAGFFFLLGYSIYLYLPVRSLANPPFDWGNPETFERFISHITDKKDTESHFSSVKSFFSLFHNVSRFAQITLTELTVIGLFFAFVGLICHFKRDKRSFTLFSLIAFINTLFFMTDDLGYLFLVSFLIFTFWIGLGIYALIAESRGFIFNFKYKNLIIPITIIFVIFSFVKDYVYNNKSSYYLPRDHSLEMHLNMEQNAIVFSYFYHFHFRYFKDLEFLRPDITLILLSDIIRPDLFDPVNQRRFPVVNFPSIESKRENQHEFIQSLISRNIDQKPIYWDLKSDLTKYNYQFLVPENKFLMRFKKHKVDKISNKLLEDFFLKLANSMERELDDEHFFLDQNMGVRNYYYNFLINFIDYLMKRKMYLKAISFLKLAASVTYPDSGVILNQTGFCYLNLRNFKKAEEIFIKLYKKNKKSSGYSYNLALLYFEKEELEKSKDYLKNAMMLSDDFWECYFLLGLIHEKKGNYDQSIKEISYAIEKTKFLPDKKKMQEALKRVKKVKSEKRI